MTFKEIQDLIKLVSKSELAEFKIKDGEFQLQIRTKYYSATEGGQSPVPTPIISVPPVPQPFVAGPSAAPPTPTSPAPASPAGKSDDAPGEAAGEEDTSRYVAIKSPMVGTFYRSSSPDKPPFVKVGDMVAVGDTVCIVEAMKLFNEIESEVSGRIVKVAIEDANPVEYDQVLFLVDPKG